MSDLKFDPTVRKAKRQKGRGEASGEAKEWEELEAYSF